jgi:hypothetical protein
VSLAFLADDTSARMSIYSLTTGIAARQPSLVMVWKQYPGSARYSKLAGNFPILCESILQLEIVGDSRQTLAAFRPPALPAATAASQSIYPF